MTLHWEDKRYSGRQIAACFQGTLREEQQPAFDALSAQDNGVLAATTAFGITVIGAALIGQKRVNTLILVHRTQLMQQWKERLTSFLALDERLPETPHGCGRRKKRELIGEYGNGKDTRGGIVDIAILQSLGSGDTVKPWIGEYGMVIVDECHHIPAISFEAVLKKVHAVPTFAGEEKMVKGQMITLLGQANQAFYFADTGKGWGYVRCENVKIVEELPQE